MLSMANTLLNVTLDERDKRILLIVFLLILLLLLLLGGLNRLLNAHLEKSAKDIEPPLASYMKYGLVINEKELKKLGEDKAYMMFFKDATIPFITMLGIFIVFIIYCAICRVDWTYIFGVYDDIMFELTAPTTIIFGIEIWADWPTIVEDSIIIHNNFEGYIAYALFISFIVGFFWYLFASLRLDARLKRAGEKAKEYFTDKVEDAPIKKEENNQENKEEEN